MSAEVRITCKRPYCVSAFCNKYIALCCLFCICVWIIWWLGLKLN